MRDNKPYPFVNVRFNLQTIMSTITDLFAPFTATVDPSLISSASNFFDNSTDSIIRELLQNSRRSGATEVHLNTTGERWIYTDNGPGCSPQDLLGLGSSRWTEAVKAAESPAGCGFFSLARRNPEVLCPSRGWRVSLKEGHFNGQLQIEPLSASVPEGDERGLVIAFDTGDTFRPYGLQEMATFMDLDFYLDGVQQKSRRDFLASPSNSLAHRVIQYSEFVKVRVDLVPGTSASYRACYHGFTVDLAEREHLNFGTIGDKTYCVQTSVLVTRERALPLELPQRNKMVQSGDTRAIKDIAYRTGLALAAEALKEICIASPKVWLDARFSRGYQGAVLYTKFIGRLVTREENCDLSDHSMELEDKETYCHGRYVTFDEFEDSDFRMVPSEELMALIAQTTIPCSKDESGRFSTYDIDLDEYFAPGLRLLERLESLKGLGWHSESDPASEGAEWFNRLLRLTKARSSWDDNVTVIAEGTADGKPIRYEGDPSRGLDTDNLYDSIRLEFRSDDDGDDAPAPVSLPADALFWLPGSDYDTDLDFILTRDWLDTMGNSFPGEIANAAYLVRECRDRGDDDEVTVDKIADELRAKLALFSGVDEFYQEKILETTEEAVRSAVYHLEPKPSKVVVTVELGGQHNSVQTSSKCEFVPKFVPYYTFRGDQGGVECDEQGHRNPVDTAYPEYHSFDVATMKQAGLEPGERDIVDACGWHDSTKRIYVTPALPHLLWSLGFLPVPYHVTQDEEVSDALAAALKAGKVSPTLYSALWYEQQALVKTVVPKAMEDLPPIRRVWIYETVMP